MSNFFVPRDLRSYLIARKALDQIVRTYPWYNSVWLRQYVAAKIVIERVRPELLPEFINAFDRLRTRPDFSVRKLDRVFDDGVFKSIREVVNTLSADKLEKHEAKEFGRVVVHNHTLLTHLQETLLPLVSELAGEAVEPSYNFLSLYTQSGVCQPHLDAPNAKWTLDVCIDQSVAWPIFFSQIVPWPEDFRFQGDDWQAYVKQSTDLKFTSYSLQPNEALLFSGSSQWHYRDSFSRVTSSGHCNLVFFHFFPAGMADIVRPKRWPEIFNIPELEGVVGALTS